MRRIGTPHSALASLPDSTESKVWKNYRGPEQDKRKRAPCASQFGGAKRSQIGF